MTHIDLIAYAGGALVATVWIAICAAAGLRAWNGWLALKHAELERGRREASDAGQSPLSAAARIDVADLKERIRKLEAIASGVEF